MADSLEIVILLVETADFGAVVQLTTNTFSGDKITVIVRLALLYGFDVLLYI